MDSNFKFQLVCLLVICVLYVFGNQGSLSDIYIGCYNDTSKDMVFTNKLEMMKLTPDACRTSCNNRNNKYIGLWGGINCWCSDIQNIEILMTRLNDSSCSSRCTGNRSVFCGGPSDSVIFSVYTVCPKGTYGSDCKKPCNCKDNNSCSASGACPNLDCAPGWGQSMIDDPNRRRCSVDINECSLGLPDNQCEPSAGSCFNSEGTYSCTCKEGYENNGTKACKDIDECTQGLEVNECHPSTGQCSNFPGDYNCSCLSGYINNGSRHICQDVDECLLVDPKNECDNETSTCQNTPGSYSCQCLPGYEPGENPRQRSYADGTGIIVGAVVGTLCAILAILAIIAGIYFYRKKTSLVNAKGCDAVLEISKTENEGPHYSTLGNTKSNEREYAVLKEINTEVNSHRKQNDSDLNPQYASLDYSHQNQAVYQELHDDRTENATEKNQTNSDMNQY